MKRIVAVCGDHVKISAEGMFVNGSYFGPVQAFDSEGFFLPRLNKTFVLKDDELFMAGDHKRSFDCRYFGPVKKTKIYGLAKPFLTF